MAEPTAQSPDSRRATPSRSVGSLARNRASRAELSREWPLVPQMSGWRHEVQDGPAYFTLRRARSQSMPAPSSPRPAVSDAPSISGTLLGSGQRHSHRHHRHRGRQDTQTHTLHDVAPPNLAHCPSSLSGTVQSGSPYVATRVPHGVRLAIAGNQRLSGSPFRTNRDLRDSYEDQVPGLGHQEDDFGRPAGRPSRAEPDSSCASTADPAGGRSAGRADPCIPFAAGSAGCSRTARARAPSSRTRG